MRLLVFLHGTTLMHPSAVGRTRSEPVAQVRPGADPSQHDFASYVPVEGAVAKLRLWHEQGAHIEYLSSHPARTTPPPGLAGALIGGCE